LPLRIYDSFAILKLFQKEQSHQKVARLLKEDIERNEAPALREKAAIVTGDPEFEKVESLCRIEWV